MFKVYHKKYTKDEGVLVGVERINEQSGNWEYNTVTDTEWKLGTIAIKEGQGMLERKQFITTDVDGELLFEGDKVHPVGLENSIIELKKGEFLETHYGHGDSSSSMYYGFKVHSYGDEKFKLKLVQ